MSGEHESKPEEHQDGIFVDATSSCYPERSPNCILVPNNVLIFFTIPRVPQIVLQLGWTTNDPKLYWQESADSDLISKWQTYCREVSTRNFVQPFQTKGKKRHLPQAAQKCHTILKACKYYIYIMIDKGKKRSDRDMKFPYSPYH
jgi:hypothetical protein